VGQDIQVLTLVGRSSDRTSMYLCCHLSYSFCIYTLIDVAQGDLGATIPVSGRTQDDASVNLLDRSFFPIAYLITVVPIHISLEIADL
jgi:hypothetical protein